MIELASLESAFASPPARWSRPRSAGSSTARTSPDGSERTASSLRKSFVDPVRHFALLLFRLRRSESDAARQALNLLDEARARTRDLIYPLTEAQLVAQHSPLMSPIVWDLAHIANYEEQGSPGRCPESPASAAACPPSATTSTTPSAIPVGRAELCRSCGARAVWTTWRRCDAALEQRSRRRPATPLSRCSPTATSWSMLAQHEAQHEETVLQAIQLLDGLVYEPHLRRDPDHAASSVAPAMVTIAAGSFPIGTDDRAIAYDNERPEHVAELERFRIDLYPVSNGQFLEFVLDGGYRRRELWSDEGWSWLCEARVEHPAQWIRSARGPWLERQFGRIALARPAAPGDPRLVVRKRTPTRGGRGSACLPRRNGRRRRRAISRTASRGPIRGATSRPLSRANLDQRTFAPSQLGAYPEGRSFFGCQQMLGDVSGMDGERVPALSGIPGLPLSGVLRGALRARTSRAPGGLGRRVRSPSATPSATGTCRNAVRSSPGSAVRATTELSARRALSPDDS